MNWKAFNQLLKRYVEGKCSEEERQLIDQWYELLSDEFTADLNDAELENIDRRLWQKIQGETNQRPVTGKPSRISNIWVKVAAAAIITGIIALGTALWQGSKDAPVFEETDFLEEQMVTRTNNTDKAIQVPLEEGTVITLKAYSSVHYPRQFDKDKREVYLEGNAFFNVSKSAVRPFYVYNDKLVTQVLGTSFDVRTDKKSGLVEIAVSTGKVAVYESAKHEKKLPRTPVLHQNGGVLLTQNQKVTYYAAQGHFVTSLVDAPAPLPDVAGKPAILSFNFEDEPLDTVLASLKKTYGIEIVIENENLSSCPFTGDITEQNLHDKLEFICSSIGATYEIKGTTILIRGRGCN